MIVPGNKSDEKLNINKMKNFPYGVCTLTLGKCMNAMNLPYNYIFIWLFFKLPFLSLMGLILFPFAERRIFLQPTRQIIFGSILLTLISIIFILIYYVCDQMLKKKSVSNSPKMYI